jgi:hypothetical protein
VGRRLGAALFRPTTVGIIQAIGVRGNKCKAGQHQIERSALGDKSNFEAANYNIAYPTARADSSVTACGHVLTFPVRSAITPSALQTPSSTGGTIRSKYQLPFLSPAPKGSCLSRSGRACRIRATVPPLQRAHLFPRGQPETDIPFRPIFSLWAARVGGIFETFTD